MSTHANFAIQSRSDLKEYIMRRLGAPLISIELTEAHLDDAIDDATEYFSKYVNLNQEFLVLSLDGYESSQQKITQKFSSYIQSVSADSLTGIPSGAIADFAEMLAMDSSTVSNTTGFELQDYIRNLADYDETTMSGLVPYLSGVVDISDGYVSNPDDPKNKNGIKLPERVLGVFSIDPNDPNTANVFGFAGLGGGLINSMYSTQMYGMMGSNGFYSDAGFSFATQANISNFRSLSRTMTGKGYDFNFDTRSHYLTLYPQPDKVARLNHSIIIGCHYVNDEEYMFGETWVKQYSLAQAKRMLGTIRRKYTNVSLPGGGTIDASIGDEGKEEAEALEKNIMSRECNIFGFFIG